MNKKLLALFLFIVSVNVVLAQEYYIQTNHNTNLRVLHSTNSGIVETVTRGTVLHVIGEFNRWLKINRNGNEVWMASWVSHTRVEGNQQAQPASQIDNCCHVDRQCNTNQEWVDGYWAFQNNECIVPSQSSATTAPDLPLPLIEGSSSFVSKTVEAFHYIRDRSLNWFNYAVSKISSIGQRPPFDPGSRAYVRRRRVEISDEHDDDTVLLASVLIHEACHIHQWDAGRWYSLDPTTREVECLQIQLDAVSEMAPHSWVNNMLRRAIRNPRISYG